ncbi:extracellular catalytic domain type 1 short-chain-length polyhydroxyalkanoate depolymerase [Streptomyces pactum]|uniref:extracellular catalytic domain type 1 short-chain-length polyhydroxyalkanoate depolymerase n=1 Tax=Streptomyces pactum TaxID=68249 RepID=UPI00370179CA
MTLTYSSVPRPAAARPPRPPVLRALLSVLTALAALSALLLSAPGTLAAPATADDRAAGPGAGAGAIPYAGTIEQVSGFGTNPGALTMYRYTPPGLPSGRPVVVVLHGCTQTAPDYGTRSGWLQLADRWGFSVVLPGQTTLNNLNRCFNWFLTGDITRGRGEAESIRQMADRQLADTGGDRSRVYVTGLSAGGGMTAVMTAAYPDRFAGGGVVAGLPYGCAQAAGSPYVCMYVGATQTPDQWGDRVRAAAPAGYTGPWPRMTVVQGTADTTVRPVNMTDLVAQWTDVHGTDRTPDATDTVAGQPHHVYRNAGGTTVVDTYTINGMGHGQPVAPGTGPQQCGSTGPYLLDVGLCAAHWIGTGWGLDRA